MSNRLTHKSDYLIVIAESKTDKVSIDKAETKHFRQIIECFAQWVYLCRSSITLYNRPS